jgi:hypothetical protein
MAGMFRIFGCARLLARATLVAVALQSSLAGAAPTAHGRSVAGKYEAGPSRLELLDSGQFRYVGGHSCFNGYSDVGLPNEFSGRYRLAGDWLSLEQLQGGAHIEGCGIDLKLFVLKTDGRPLLLGESYLRFIVNQRRSGKPTDKFYPYHRVGEPAEFSKDPEDWLPQPYADLFKMPPRSGQVVEVGDVSTGTVYGSAGRVMGQESHARLTINIGRRHGAFKGMRVCSPGARTAVLSAVEDDSASLMWSWSVPDGVAPTIGMPLSGYCP